MKTNYLYLAAIISLVNNGMYCVWERPTYQSSVKYIVVSQESDGQRYISPFLRDKREKVQASAYDCM